MLRPSLTFFIGNGFVLKRISAKSAYIDLEQPGRFWQFPETLRMSEMGSEPADDLPIKEATKMGARAVCERR